MTMNDEKMFAYREWREAILKQIRIGRRLERIARMLELPFEVRAHWHPAGIDWCVYGDSLANFSERVRRTAARLGPADSVKAEHLHGAFDDHAPDLVATWTASDKDGSIPVTVRALRPEGCKIDPRTSFEARKEPALHPECSDVLRELEEAGA